MKSIALAVAAFGTVSLFAADPVSSGFFDFGQFSPPKSGGEFVEVNVKGNLISMAAKIAAKQEPEAAEFLRSIESVRVNVIGLDESNRAEIKNRIDTIRTGLDSAGWERIVTVQQEGEDVGVYTKTHGAEAIAGVVVTVLSGGGQAVLVNVVGNIKPEKLAELGEHLHIKPLKNVIKTATQADEADEKK